MKEKFIEQLKDVFEMENCEIKFEDNFREFEKWDSLANISLIAMLDNEFGVTIENSEFKKIITIGELFEEVNRRMKM